MLLTLSFGDALMEQFNLNNQNPQQISSQSYETLLLSALETIALRLEKMEEQIKTLDRNLGNLSSRIGEWHIQEGENHLHQGQPSLTYEQLQELILSLNKLKNLPQKKDLEDLQQQTLNKLLETSQYLQQLPMDDMKVNLDSLNRSSNKIDDRLYSLDKTVNSFFSWKKLVGMGIIGSIAGAMVAILGINFFTPQPTTAELYRSISMLYERMVEIEQHLNNKSE
jgi:hypothetical protein